MTTLIDLQKELEPYENTLVIDGFNIVLLVDVIEGEEDFYWVYYGRRGVIHSSCVGRWTPLKGILPDKAYNELVRVWNLNNTTKAI